MQKTRREALDEFLGWAGELGDSVARNVAERALARAIETIWQKHPWRDFQSPSPLELTLVVNQRSYPLPALFGRLGFGRVRNLTKGTELFPMDTDQAQEAYPSAGTSLEQGGSPRHYELSGIVGVMRQPNVNGEAIEAFSDDGNDTTVRVAVEGADANGHERRIQVTLSSTSPVAIGTFSYIDSFGKSYAEGVDAPTEFTTSAGTVTLRTATDHHILQQLFPEESAREHRIITFYPKPAEADVIAIPVMRRPKRLVYDADVLPGDWWNAIFEELQVAWLVNRGELAVDSVVPRPHLTDLIANDNANRAPRRTRPFGVMPS